MKQLNLDDSENGDLLNFDGPQLRPDVAFWLYAGIGLLAVMFGPVLKLARAINEWLNGEARWGRGVYPHTQRARLKRDCKALVHRRWTI